MARDCVPCRGGGTRQRLVTAVNAGRPTSSGSYPLATYPDCTNAHTGDFVGSSLFVVGRLTDKERLFRRSEMAAASVYSQETRLVLENLPTTAICDQAVLDLYSPTAVE